MWQDGRLVNKQKYDRALEITVECDDDGKQYLRTPYGYIGYNGNWRLRFAVGNKESGWRKPYELKKANDYEHYNSYEIKYDKI